MRNTALRTLVRWQDADPSALAGGTVVVIDVLRWSTVVVTALAHGASRVEAFA
ncbi:MAG: 2-phosphosulfolactate phosphatase, partial [Rhodanobacter sp.]